MDSGAMITAMNKEECPNVPVEDSQAKKMGVKYEVANGTLISNEGQKRLNGVTEDGATFGITAQICGVTKPLMSVDQVCGAGNQVIFDDDGSFIRNKHTGATAAIKKEGKRYIFPLWVRKPAKHF